MTAAEFEQQLEELIQKKKLHNLTEDKSHINGAWYRLGYAESKKARMIQQLQEIGFWETGEQGGFVHLRREFSTGEIYTAIVHTNTYIDRSPYIC